MDTNEKDHARDNARAWASTIAEHVTALECDYDRLEELRDEREAAVDAVNEAMREYEADKTNELAEAHAIAANNLMAWDSVNGEEFGELTADATIDGEIMESADAVRERIQESPLEVSVRSGWASVGDAMNAEEFCILLTTGGPALRIRGELDEHGQPYRAWLEYQDWGTPWTEYHPQDGEGCTQDDLLTFCQQFYFGE